jgi:hypothetical protein
MKKLALVIYLLCAVTFMAILMNAINKVDVVNASYPSSQDSMLYSEMQILE